MTREEAIAELSVLHERLLNPKDCEDGCYSWEDGWYVEAIDMAIEALSAPQTDLISRADAITVVWASVTRDSATEKIEALPPADAVEVVMCKDCKHNLGETTGGKSVVCNYCTHGMLIERNNEWFCADGERKGGDSE